MKSSAQRWRARLIDPALLAQLERELPASTLWSVLLGVVAQRAQQAPAAVLRQWQQNRFVAPASVEQRALLEIDAELLAAAAGFAALELSPLAPLGACSSVALTSQDRVVSSTRGTEVVADPTNLLALESAVRLRRQPGATVKLATSHRCVRAQELPKLPGYAAHFRMFCLTTAGKQTADQSFLVDSVREHIDVHLHALDRLTQRGYGCEERRVRIFASPACAPLARRIAAELPHLRVVHEPLTQAYYAGLRFMIDVRTPHGDLVPLIDGGAFDWLERLAANRKLVFVASALGSQLVAALFRRRAPSP